MSNFDIKVRDAFCGQQYYSAKDFKAFERGFKQGHKDRQPEIDHLKKWGEGKENKALKDKLEEVTRELSALKEAYDIQAKALEQAEQGGWISVATMLPPSSDDCNEVLVCFATGDTGSAIWNFFSEPGHGEAQKHDGMKFMLRNSDWDYGGLFVATTVTHWKSWPAAPKGDV